MANLNKKTKAELIEIIESQDKTLMQLNNDEHSLRIEKDKFEQMYQEVDKQNKRLNDQALELDTKVKAAAEEVINLSKEKQNLITQIKGLHADIDGMSKQVAEKEQQLKNVRKANRGMFAGLVLVLIVWLLTLIQFAI